MYTYYIYKWVIVVFKCPISTDIIMFIWKSKSNLVSKNIHVQKRQISLGENEKNLHVQKRQISLGENERFGINTNVTERVKIAIIAKYNTPGYFDMIY